MTHATRPSRRSAALVAALAAPLLLAACAGRDRASDSADLGVVRAQTGYAIVNGERVAPPSIPMGNPATIERILDQGKHHNQVMDHLTYLCEKIGPRLTGSANAEAANKWARDKFETWGLSNAHLFEWGEVGLRFDRLPSSAKVVVEDEHADEGVRELRELQFTWPAWSRGTDGPVRGPVIPMPSTMEDYEDASANLTGAWILVQPEYGGGPMRFSRGRRAQMERFADIRERIENGEYQQQPELVDPAAFVDDGLTGRWEGTMSGNRARRGIAYFVDFQIDEQGAVTGTAGIPGYRVSDMKNASYDPDTGHLVYTWEGSGGDSVVTLDIAGEDMTGSMPSTEEGAEPYTLELTRAVLTPEQQNADIMRDYVTALVLEAKPAGFVFSTQSELTVTGGTSGWREMTTETMPEDVTLMVTEADYDFMAARLAEGLPIQLECDMACETTDGPIKVYNTIAEIPGTTRPDEVVIVSGHLDSWDGPGTQGATDNGTGSAVTLEAARILMAAGAKPKRTIRFILWTGEEQGLLGSEAYVASLSDEEKSRISAVLVDDGGTNSEGGLQCIASMADYLAAATAPVNGNFISQTDALANSDEDDAGLLNVDVQTRDRMPRGGGSDHVSFNQVGIPGFFWDEVGRQDYNHAHHTQFDTLEYAIPEYLEQSATCAAITAYNLACAPDLLPREQPEPESEGDRSN